MKLLVDFSIYVDLVVEVDLPTFVDLVVEVEVQVEVVDLVGLESRLLVAMAIPRCSLPT